MFSEAQYNGPVSAVPKMREVIREYLPLPKGALFLGIAEDGFPVLLNLADPTPGPILVTGRQDTYKTEFLQKVARGIRMTRNDEEIHFSVVTTQTSAWAQLQDNPHTRGIYPMNSDGINGFFAANTQAQYNKDHAELLFIDDFAAFLHNIPSHRQDAFEDILIDGPSRRIWPFVTVHTHSGEMEQMDGWLRPFQTRIVAGGVFETRMPGLSARFGLPSEARVRGIQFIVPADELKPTAFYLPR